MEHQWEDHMRSWELTSQLQSKIWVCLKMGRVPPKICNFLNLNSVENIGIGGAPRTRRLTQAPTSFGWGCSGCFLLGGFGSKSHSSY